MTLYSTTLLNMSQKECTTLLYNKNKKYLIFTGINNDLVYNFTMLPTINESNDTRYSMARGSTQLSIFRPRYNYLTHYFITIA